MTTQLVERTDEELIAELPDPNQDEDYIAAKEKLTKLAKELESLRSKTAKARLQLTDLQVEDAESADKAVKLDRQIEQLPLKAARMVEAVEFQRQQVEAEFKRAQREYQLEAKRVWKDVFVPELVELVERLSEIREIYRQLKRNGGGLLKPVFPSAIYGALGNSLWLKRRKEEWAQE